MIDTSRAELVSDTRRGRGRQQQQLFSTIQIAILTGLIMRFASFSVIFTEVIRSCYCNYPFCRCCQGRLCLQLGYLLSVCLYVRTQSSCGGYCFPSEVRYYYCGRCKNDEETPWDAGTYIHVLFLWKKRKKSNKRSCSLNKYLSSWRNPFVSSAAGCTRAVSLAAAV